MRFFEQLIEDLDAIVWEADSETLAFSYVSSGAERMLGYPIERWLTEPDFWLEMIHPADRARAEEFCRAQAKAGVNHEFRYRAIHADGRVVWLQDRVRVVTDDSGRAVSLRGVITDATEHVANEETVARHEELLRTSLESLLDGFGIYSAVRDERGEIVDFLTEYMNAEGGRLNHYRPEAQVGRTLRELFPEAATPRLLTDLRRVVDTGEPYVGESLDIQSEGDPVITEVRATRLGDGFAAIFRDVTESKRQDAAIRASELRFRTLVHNAPDGIIVVDAKARIAYYSAAAERLMGVAAHELLGTNALDLVHPEDLVSARGILERLSAEPNESESAELRIRRGDGEWRQMWAIATNRLHDPAVGGIVVNFRDVTSQRAAEAVGRQLEEQLHHAQRMEAVGRLAGGIAHDFNNLLAVISNYANFIREDASDAQAVRDDVSQIQNAARRAAALVRQLLLFSRKDTPVAEPLDVDEVVRETTHMLDRVIGEDIVVEYQLGAAPTNVGIDRSKLEQVVTNLMVNARDAMPGGGRLTVATERLVVEGRGLDLPAGAYVVVAVSDTGVGMDEETADRIFEPFFTTKPQGKGTGLGLSTVYGIVQSVGGRVTVESKPDEGSVFRVMLPVTTKSVSGPAESRVDDEAGVEFGTVLVVEDEDGVRRLVCRILEQNGYTVRSAASGREAIVMVDEIGPIDVVLTDVIMPDMNGRELAERIGDRSTVHRVVFMSGYPENYIDGVGTWLKKPFSAEELLAHLRAVLTEH
ncbi:MAG: hybrid sensor histidine kinase/response regulator [Actinomycetota bacterium]